MEAHRRIQQLSLRRKEKLKQILESQLSPDVSLKQKLLIINQALINVDDLFDQGMSFSQVIQELRFRIDRELSTTARKIESDSKLSHHQQQFQTLNNQRRNYNDQYNVNKSSANIQRTENQNYNSFISAKNINHGSEKSLSE